MNANSKTLRVNEKGETSASINQPAKKKIQARKIFVDEIRKAVSDTDWREVDKIDPGLTHLIYRIGKKFLRRIGRMEDDKTIVVVSAFFDRRIKEGKKDNPV